MSRFGSTVTAAEIYAAARETCSRLYVACGGPSHELWTVHPHPHTAAIARDYGGWKLVMPAMPLDARLTRREADVLIGYVTHELGHALFTDFAVWEDARKEGLHNVVNGLEDIRIESELAKHGGAIGNA